MIARKTERFKKVYVKPCPCCGGDDIYLGFHSAISMGVNCRDCGLNVHRTFPDGWSAKVDIELVTLRKAAVVWNRRKCAYRGGV